MEAGPRTAPSSDQRTGSSPFHDPDVSPLQIDVGNLVRLLVKEEQLTQARKRADKLERENFDGSECPRWARNCTILIRKLKMSDMEISKAILLMDSNEQLTLDMVEQLLKFTPSAEDEHSEDIKSLARADCSLYEVSKLVINTTGNYMIPPDSDWPH
ncbi:uncharacterized protein LOC110182006 [Drosophila serrata]|uniref:uncharacterized protein LOC110182006 n=1 Tax=Drosophila serrata TaxID=7274 RepID=UPI000A1D03CE|nr:uncharacterized protein LOC110182006 [Drosophila serrata]